MNSVHLRQSLKNFVLQIEIFEIFYVVGLL
jgi:hypothetical protein